MPVSVERAQYSRGCAAVLAANNSSYISQFLVSFWIILQFFLAYKALIKYSFNTSILVHSLFGLEMFYCNWFLFIISIVYSWNKPSLTIICFDCDTIKCILGGIYYMYTKSGITFYPGPWRIWETLQVGVQVVLSDIQAELRLGNRWLCDYGGNILWPQCGFWR